MAEDHHPNTGPENAARRTLLKLSGASLAAFGAASFGNATPAKAQTMSGNWDRIFTKSALVDHRKLAFTNCYDITPTGDLYIPKGAGLPALAVAGPFGAVKERSAGLYAQTMAERGYRWLSILHSPGKAAARPGPSLRPTSIPKISAQNTEDFSAAIDDLGLQQGVDRESPGIIGICGFGGMALNGLAVDKRVKAVGVASMYDMSRVMARGYYDSLPPEDRTAAFETMSRQRWTDAGTSTPALAGGLPKTLDGINNPVISMYWDYYKTPREGPRTLVQLDHGLDGNQRALVHEHAVADLYRRNLTPPHAADRGRESAFAPFQRRCLCGGDRTQRADDQPRRRSRRSL